MANAKCLIQEILINMYVERHALAPWQCSDACLNQTLSHISGETKQYFFSVVLPQDNANPEEAVGFVVTYHLV